MQIDPRPQRVVNRAEQLPIEMRSDAEAAEIGVGGGGEPVSEIIMIARGNQRVGPGETVRQL